MTLALLTARCRLQAGTADERVRQALRLPLDKRPVTARDFQHDDYMLAYQCAEELAEQASVDPLARDAFEHLTRARNQPDLDVQQWKDTHAQALVDALAHYIDKTQTLSDVPNPRGGP